MKKINYILFIPTLFLLVYCKKDPKIVLESENKIFETVFLNIVDSTYKEGRLYLKDFPNGTAIETRIAELKKDTSKLVFAIDIEKYKIDLKKYNNKKFTFKDISEFPRGNRYEIWETKYDFEFAGALYFSTIKFDKQRKNGILKVSYGCGTKCGWGYQVFIKKNGQNWFVEKVTVINMS